MASSAASPKLVQVLTAAVASTGHDLEDLGVSPAGKRQVVRVLVDRDGGTNLDAVAEVSKALSVALDALDTEDPDLLGTAYVLEVSSPGVDRPLTLARHWRRNVGRLVTAHVADGTSVTGRLTSADDLEVVLDVDGSERALLLAELLRGQVQVEFSRPGAPEPDDTEDDTEDDDDPEDEL